MRSPTSLLAHGAGAAMTSPFLEKMTRPADRAWTAGIPIRVRLYGSAAERRETAPAAARRAADAGVRARRRAVARAGRGPADSCSSAASRWAGASPASSPTSCSAAGLIDGLVCLGYPFHPPDKPDNLRTAHLGGSALPGPDRAGRARPVRRARRGRGLSAVGRRSKSQWAGDGDHDLGPRGGSGFTRAANLALAADAIAAFAGSVGKPSRS